MTWLKLDDGFIDHPKIETLSDAAFRLHIRGMSYCARFRTDGAVPAAKVATWAKPKIVAECVDAGVWHLDGSTYAIHDYLDYNPSRADFDKKSIAGAKGAATRYGKAPAIAGASQDAIAVPSRPVPSQDPEPEPEIPPVVPPLGGASPAMRARNGSKRQRDVIALRGEQTTEERYLGKYAGGRQ